MKNLMVMVLVLMMAATVIAAEKGVWDKSAQDTYTKLYNEANYVGARSFIENIDFTKSENLKSQYVSYQLGMDRAEGKKASSVDSAKAQTAVYVTKIGLTDQAWIDYNVLAHLYDSLADKQLVYDYYKTISNPNEPTKNFGIRSALDVNVKLLQVYIKLYNEANYVAARTYLDGIDFTANDVVRNQYVSCQLTLDRAEGKKASSIDSAKAQVAAYATKIGLTDQGWMEYNVLAHLYESLDDKQISYDYYKSLAAPNTATKRFAIKVCNALKKVDEAKAISVAIGDSK